MGEKVTDPHVTDILLGIKEDIGALNARMDESAASRRRLEEGQAQFRQDLLPVQALAGAVAEMKPQVIELQEFKSKISGYLTVATIMISGGIMLLWNGAQYFGDQIRARLFH